MEKFWLLEKLHVFLEQPGDDDLARRRKMLVPLGLVAVIACGLLVVPGFVASGDWRESTIFHVALLEVVWSGLSLWFVVARKKVSGTVILSQVLLGSLCAMYLDYRGAATSSFRPWPLLIVGANILLVLQVGMGWVTFVFGTGVVWLVFVQAELTFRFGFFDLIPYEDRAAVCACDDPPCKSRDAFAEGVFQIALSLVIFAIDFIFTKTFSEQAIKEHAYWRRCEGAAREIATQLSRFSLTEAEHALIREQAFLTPEFHAVFRQLLANLRLYEPFLPQSCFPGTPRSGDDHDGTRNPLSPLGGWFTEGEESAGPSDFELSSDKLALSGSTARGAVGVKAKGKDRIRLPSGDELPSGSQVSSTVPSSLASNDVGRRPVTVFAVNVKGSLGLLKHKGAFEEMQRSLRPPRWPR
ncbi:hypothetical protein DIPPA_22602 [Diplonema papillatum]|nr:hypothetical protein DIPPA_22602 [Diplonema papillatum]